MTPPRRIATILGMDTQSLDENPQFSAGRVQGLRDAADLLRTAANKEFVTKIFVPGQQPKMARAMNRGLLNKVADIVDSMAHDRENRTGPFAPPTPLVTPDAKA